ncbi:MAG: bifunctional diguanylate cyclase/phosphodiesterase [Ruminococcus sp.]|nr:bifunctional diguanylate cyclase/phosphodiesterase [Ruminococcus sp.]
MREKNAPGKKKSIIERTLDSLSDRNKAPMAAYVVLAVLYIVCSAIVTLTADNGNVMKIGGGTVAVYAFAGVFSALSNIFIIFIVLFYGKLGFRTAMVFLCVQLPMIMSGIFIRGNYASLPGLVTDIFTIIAIIMLYKNNERVDRYQRKLRDQAVNDMLTNLPNRFACSELINDLIKHGEKFTVVSIDINNFKSINDTMGFKAGNSVLIEIASRWKTIADSGLSSTLDFITRVAGDEFALIIRNYRSADDVVKTVRQYEAALGNRVTVDDCDLYITASFGYAEFPTDADNFDSLFSYSNAAMAEVKRQNSSDHILRFSSELLKAGRTLEIEHKIRTALDEDTIYFQLQPQFDLSHKLRGFEALARIKDSEGNNISPGEFIPIAEKVGLVDKIDGAVFRKSAEFFGELLRKSPSSDVTLSVNVSVRHLMKNDFVEEIRSIVENSGVPASQLEIEITESIMIDSADKALQCIKELKNMGMKIAIDDFGTGYSSLSYLNKFPANLLKIDKSFIDKMNASDSSKKYVAAIISIGHIMNFDVISEGVEKEEQLETLREIGCDYIQGYIWGRPLPTEDAEALYLNAV